MNLLIRLLSLLSYFLPFVFYLSTCTGSDGTKEAYNKAEAIANERERRQNHFIGLDSLFGRSDSIPCEDIWKETRESIRSEHAASAKLQALDQEIKMQILMPTEFSLSGFGCIWFHKNQIGKISIVVSICLSLLLLVFYSFLEKRKLVRHFITVQLIVVLLFIANCLLNEVTLLYGVWVVLFLLLVQFQMELKKGKDPRPME